MKLTLPDLHNLPRFDENYIHERIILNVKQGLTVVINSDKIPLAGELNSFCNDSDSR